MTFNSDKHICGVSVLRDEEKFLDEWLVYHKRLGINHFFLFDNDQKQNLGLYLQPHHTYTTVIPWFDSNAEKTQIQAFRIALKDYINEFEWVIFFDVDEFVVLQSDRNLKYFLSRYPNATAVSLNWHIFGHNGMIEDPERLITSSLVKRMRNMSSEVKTFTKVAAISSIQYPHYCELKFGLRINSSGEECSNTISKISIANINHYQCRSYNRWIKRADRGDVNFRKENCPNSESWRLDKGLLQNRFIKEIARGHNEVIDNRLKRFRFILLKEINKLKRLKPEISSHLDEETLIQIRAFLNNFAKWLMENVGDFCISKPFEFKISCLIFFIKFKSCFKNKSVNASTDLLFKSLITEMDSEAENHLFSQAFQFGNTIEYFVKNSMLKKDTNKYLRDIDTLAEFQVLMYENGKKPKPKLFLQQLIYHLSRLSNPVNDYWHDQERINQTSLDSLCLMDKDLDFSSQDYLFLLEFLATTNNNNRSAVFDTYIQKFVLSRLDTAISEVINLPHPKLNYLKILTFLYKIACRVSSIKLDEAISSIEEKVIKMRRVQNFSDDNNTALWCNFYLTRYFVHTEDQHNSMLNFALSVDRLVTTKSFLHPKCSNEDTTDIIDLSIEFLDIL
ncbi:glycosyltransferase family 2 protein [Pedobacter duraquae]|uniref:Glycosyl transferase family 2 n=1 Tax=Pedobacter duraquae TaxID=425511 RepID=A0A4R6IK18_9SPHI|nr:glycosyltransferase family 2 protein [Pedobacter duraquae]TDO22363.1 glycosyl transferase family 2 [Pedobacter duraquae]